MRSPAAVSVTAQLECPYLTNQEFLDQEKMHSVKWRWVGEQVKTCPPASETGRLFSVLRQPLIFSSAAPLKIRDNSYKKSLAMFVHI